MKSCNKIILLFICILYLLSMTSCMNLSDREEKYYSDVDNYVNAAGVIDHILFDDQNQVLYLGFSMMSEQFDDNCFKIVDKNYLIVVDADAKNKLKIGETVTFVTAPKYFGDGYVMPIVELTIENDCILEFETGHTNLLDWLND